MESKQTRELLFDEEHPSLADSNQSLGLFYLSQGFYDQAEPLLLEAKDNKAKVLGKIHPGYANSCIGLAFLYHDLERYQQASTQFTDGMSAFLRYLQKQVSFLSEKEKESFLMTFTYNFEAFYSFASVYQQRQPSILNYVYNYHLALKGFLFNESRTIKKNIFKSQDQSLIDLYQKWLGQKKKLYQYYQLDSPSTTCFGH